MLIDLLEELHPVDVSIIDLQSFPIDILRIGEMKMSREWQDLIQKLPEREVEMVAGELGMGHIQADPHALLFTELTNEISVDEQVVISLAAKVPGEGRHRLRNDLDFAGRIQLFEAFD